jgi:hypothetical protein
MKGENESFFYTENKTERSEQRNNSKRKKENEEKVGARVIIELKHTRSIYASNKFNIM